MFIEPNRLDSPMPNKMVASGNSAYNVNPIAVMLVLGQSYGLEVPRCRVPSAGRLLRCIMWMTPHCGNDDEYGPLNN